MPTLGSSLFDKRKPDPISGGISAFVQTCYALEFETSLTQIKKLLTMDSI